MSPLPLGIVAASGAAAGALELIQTTVLSSEASSVTFSGLSGFDYRHLQIRFVARTTRADTLDEINLRFNTISTNTYTWHITQSTGSNPSSSAWTNQNKMFVGTIPAAQNSAEVFGSGIINILDYKTGNKNVVLRSIGGMAVAGAGYTQMTSGFRNTTTSLSSVTFVPLTGPNFGSQSRFSIYGIRG